MRKKITILILLLCSFVTGLFANTPQYDICIYGESASGVIGEVGPTGATGPQGIQGIQGVTGPTGATGADAATPTLTIGTVTTGAPGTVATATITGTAPNFVLDLVIPQGPTGATGPVGA